MMLQKRDGRLRKLFGALLCLCVSVSSSEIAHTHKYTQRLEPIHRIFSPDNTRSRLAREAHTHAHNQQQQEQKHKS